MASIFDLFKQIGSQNAPAAAAGPVSFLIAGLGNPGPRYEHTRHNMGFLALDRIADKTGVRVNAARFHALCADCVIEGVRVLLMKPQTLMNASGTAVREAAAFYHLPPENIIVISDDISLAPGQMRVRRRGSCGGHNGLRNIIDQLGSDAFPRVRIGVGQKPPDWDLADWVLAPLPAADRDAALACAEDAFPACSLILTGHIDDAMSRFNKRAGSADS